MENYELWQAGAANCDGKVVIACGPCIAEGGELAQWNWRELDGVNLSLISDRSLGQRGERCDVCLEAIL